MRLSGKLTLETTKAGETTPTELALAEGVAEEKVSQRLEKMVN